MIGGSHDVGLGQGDEQSATMARSLFETPFAAQMTGIYKNNGILKVILSFAEERRFRSKKLFSQPTSQFVSQLRKECHCAAKWHSCAKIDFATAKYSAE